MKLIYHRLAVPDVHEVLDYYKSEAGRPLADRFFNGLLWAAVSRARPLAQCLNRQVLVLRN